MNTQIGVLTAEVKVYPDFYRVLLELAQVGVTSVALFTDLPNTGGISIANTCTSAVDHSGTIGSGNRSRMRSEALSVTVNDAVINDCRLSWYCCRLSRSTTSFAFMVINWIDSQQMW